MFLKKMIAKSILLLFGLCSMVFADDNSDNNSTVASFPGTIASSSKIAEAEASFSTAAVKTTINCKADWTNQLQCMKDHRSEYQYNSQMTQQSRKDVKAKIAACYISVGCKSPFPPERDDQLRKKCFDQMRDSIRVDLRTCLDDKGFTDYELPVENDDAIAWGQDAMYIQKNKCARGSKNTAFQSCMMKAFNVTFISQKQTSSGSRNKTDPCSVRKSCYNKSQFKEGCFNRQKDVKKELCNCSSGLTLDKYKKDYKKCMITIANITEDTDFNVAALSKLKDKYCKQTADPCNGFNSNKSAVGNTTTGNRTPIRGFGSSTTPAPVPFTQMDLSSVGDVDTGIMPSIGSVLNTSSDTGGGSDLSSMLSGASTGISPDFFTALMQQFTSIANGGGIFDFLLTGNGLGSLGSGGSNPFANLLSGFNGGTFDPSTLIGSGGLFNSKT